MNAGYVFALGIWIVAGGLISHVGPDILSRSNPSHHTLEVMITGACIISVGVQLLERKEKTLRESIGYTAVCAAILVYGWFF